MFASQTRWANQLTFALLLGLALLGLLIARTQAEGFYDSQIVYILTMVGIILALQTGFLSVLHPNPKFNHREASFRWYYGWGLKMVGLGTAIAILLTWFYLSQVDEGYADRQLLWEATQLRRQGVPETVIPMLLQNLSDQQNQHPEEQIIAFIGGLTAVLGSIITSSWFYLTGEGVKRAAQSDHY